MINTKELLEKLSNTPVETMNVNDLENSILLLVESIKNVHKYF